MHLSTVAVTGKMIKKLACLLVTCMHTVIPVFQLGILLHMHATATAFWALPVLACAEQSTEHTSWPDRKSLLAGHVPSCLNCMSIASVCGWARHQNSASNKERCPAAASCRSAAHAGVHVRYAAMLVYRSATAMPPRWPFATMLEWMPSKVRQLGPAPSLGALPLSSPRGRHRRQHWWRWRWWSGTSSGRHTTGTKRVAQVINVLWAEGALCQRLRTTSCCCGGRARRLLLGRCRRVHHAVHTAAAPRGSGTVRCVEYVSAWVQLGSVSTGSAQ